MFPDQQKANLNPLILARIKQHILNVKIKFLKNEKTLNTHNKPKEA